MRKNRTILALDPGLRELGFAILSGPELVTSGVRPLYDDGSANPSAITRDYVLKLDGCGPFKPAAMGYTPKNRNEPGGRRISYTVKHLRAAARVRKMTKTGDFIK